MNAFKSSVFPLQFGGYNIVKSRQQCIGNIHIRIQKQCNVLLNIAPAKQSKNECALINLDRDGMITVIT